MVCLATNTTRAVQCGLTLYSDIEKRLTYWRTWKRGVFTLGPSEYQTPELCTASTNCKPNLSYTSLCLIWSFRVNLSQVHEKFMKKIQIKWMFLKWVFWKSDEKLPIFASLTSASKITFSWEKISTLDTVFQHIIKHLNVRRNRLFSLSGAQWCDETLSRTWCNMSKTRASASSRVPNTPRNGRKQVAYGFVLLSFSRCLSTPNEKLSWISGHCFAA